MCNALFHHLCGSIPCHHLHVARPIPHHHRCHVALTPSCRGIFLHLHLHLRPRPFSGKRMQRLVPHHLSHHVHLSHRRPDPSDRRNH